MTKIIVFSFFVAAAWLVGHGTINAKSDGLLAVEVIEEPLPFYDGHLMRQPREGDEFPPLSVLLSRHRYWAQDDHLDVIVQFDAAQPQGVLHGRIRSVAGELLGEFEVDPIPGGALVLYPRIPESLLDGGAAQLEIRWLDGDQVLASEVNDFRVERFEEPVEFSGRIPLALDNPLGVEIRRLPVTVGVPFPRGVLADAAHMRLVDEKGSEVPMQVLETARWSRFGSIKWVLCDFSVDVDGGGRELFLEYGPAVERRVGEAIAVMDGDGFPRIDAGTLRLDDGVWVDVNGDGTFVKVLGAGALNGAFVEHEDGRVYRTPMDDHYEIEEVGPNKVVVLRTGWFRDSEGGDEFCQYVIRYIIHRDSPLIRIFYSWIFTGDGNRDRIANMGWEFEMGQGAVPRGFLSEFSGGGGWLSGANLLQYEYDSFDVWDDSALIEHPGGRAPGVAAFTAGGVAVYFGAKDFWQNYPSELEFADGALWFHNWPRHGRSAGDRYNVDELPEDEWRRNVVRARFAHEGEMLDFRMPDSFAENPIWVTMSGGENRTGDWAKHDPETANAQGVSRTEEMWLYFEPGDQSDANARKVLEALDGERLRVVPDPAWVAASGAFYEMHHQDWDADPEMERIYEQLALAPGRWMDWTEMYGMWTYGELAAWSHVSRNPSLYRARRKAHHGWPYSWVPFARSGDPRLHKIAEASLRQLIDASYSHYASDDVDRRMGDYYRRRVGLSNTGPLPWAGARNHMTHSMHNKYDQHWYAYYLTGFQRARDNALHWARQAKIEDPDVYAQGPYRPLPRASATMMKSFLQTYEATFDPWFLAAAHASAQGHLDYFRRGSLRGHFYNTADREFMRYTDDPDFREYYMAYADHYGDPRFGGGSWGRIGAPVVESQAFAWELTGDDYYLSRVAHFVDWVKQAVYDGEEPWYLQGAYMYGHQMPIFTGWGLDYLPTALATLHRAGYVPESVGAGFALQVRSPEQVVVMRKEAGQPLAFELSARVVGDAYLGYNRVAEGFTVPYAVYGPDGNEILSGDWPAPQQTMVEIPAAAPAGDYTLHVARGIDVPVTAVNAPEVIVVAEGGRIPRSHREGRYWFMVPEGVEAFTVEAGFPHAHGRISIWGPNGERVWNHTYHAATHEGESTVKAEIPVAPGQAGQLWRITVPGHGGGLITMDPQIPPVFATDRQRWFMPETVSGR